MSLSDHPDEIAAKAHRGQRADAPDVPDTPAGDTPVEDTPTEDAPAASDSDTLARDLAEVGGSRPERAFNVGAVVGIALSVAAAVFVIQNSQSARFEWLWFDFEVPMWTALLGAVTAGVVLVLTIIAVHQHRRRRIGRRTEATQRLRRAIGPDRSAPAT